jgi:hypothetical protein
MKGPFVGLGFSLSRREIADSIGRRIGRSWGSAQTMRSSKPGAHDPLASDKCWQRAVAQLPRSRMEDISMGLELLVAAALAGVAPQPLTAAQPKKASVELRSERVETPGLPLAESAKEVYGFRLTAQVDEKGDVSGALELDPNPLKFDEFGFVTSFGDLPSVKLECHLKFVKKAKFEVRLEPRLGSPTKEEEWQLFEIRGPKITSRLFLATPTAQKWDWGRILVSDKDGKVKYVIPVRDPGPPTKDRK